MKHLIIALLAISLCPVAAGAQEDVLQEVELAMTERNYSKALELSLMMLQKEAKDSGAISKYYAYAGLCHEALGQTEEAEKSFKRAIDYKTGSLMIYDKLIAVAKAKGDDKTYEYVLSRKASRFPEYQEEIFKRLSTHYYKTKQYEKLSGTAKALLSTLPESVKYSYYAGVAAQKENNNEEAKVFYKKVIKLQADHKGANTSLGVMLYKEAAAVFQAETKKYEAKAKPNRVDYHNYLKRLETAKDIHKEALPYLLKAYELNPDKSLKGLIKNTYLKIGETEKANKW